MLGILQFRWQRADELVIRRLRQQWRLPVDKQIGAPFVSHLLHGFPQLGLGRDLIDDATAAEGTANEAQVDLLYRQIGQLKVENDFLARKLGR